MDIKTLRYFVVVAEEKNITKAAKILMMSQPPLSNQMKHLEEELQTTLFIRGKRSLTLTEEGKFLYQKAKDIISLSEKTKQDVLLMGKGLQGTVSLGLLLDMDEEIGSSWVASFIKDNPFVRFRITNGSSDDLIEKMRLGLVSVAVIASPYDQILLNSFKVKESKFVAVFGKEHRFARINNDKIKIDELSKEPLILPGRQAIADSIRKWFKKNNSNLNVVCEVDDARNSVELASKGAGIAIVPEGTLLPSDLVLSKEIDGDRKIEYLFVWRKGHQLSTVEENFIDYVKSIYGI